jgi:hypothetical protein
MIHALNASAEIFLKLNCRVNIVVIEYSKGRETISRDVLVEVTESDKHTYIITSDEYIGSVITKKTKINLKVTNLSTTNKWDISTFDKTDYGVLSNHIVIDRNTGKFTQYSALKDISSFSSSGTCTKVDTSKKVF